MIWHCGKHEFDLGTPIIMGVLNVTPDSFSDGGEYQNLEDAVEHAERMIGEGASIIDVGGESMRPGAEEVAPEEEWERVQPVIEALVKRNICVSVDTRHAEVARKAVEAGVSVINDVSGFRTAEMRELAANCDTGLVVMHMGGNSPKDMQEIASYSDVVNDVRDWLQCRCDELEVAGVAHDRICIDPGPGFGKTPSQTIELLRNLHEFVHMGYPVMAAVSRKSFLQKVYKLESDDPKARDAASATEALMACELGATVVRTHNVSATQLAIAQLRPYVVLSLGSNIALVGAPGEERDGKIAQINHAIGQLCQLPDSQIIDIAPFFTSEPAYYEEQEEFVNTIVLLRSGVPPKELLGYLQAIENSLGRVRERENGPRTIDIDIVDYQLYNFSTPELTLPHPRASERDFVVRPLECILPGHVLANGVVVNSVAPESRVGKSTRI